MWTTTRVYLVISIRRILLIRDIGVAYNWLLSPPRGAAANVHQSRLHGTVLGGGVAGNEKHPRISRESAENQAKVHPSRGRS